MKEITSISLRIAMAVLLFVGTAGISVHQHVCTMMGASVSIERQVSCCGERTHAFVHDGTNGHETLSRTPCCDDAVRSASVDQSFEGASAPRPLTLAAVVLPADAAAGAVTLAPRTLRIDNDISPHLRLSLAETVNHLRS